MYKYTVLKIAIRYIIPNTIKFSQSNNCIFHPFYAKEKSVQIKIDNKNRYHKWIQKADIFQMLY